MNPYGNAEILETMVKKYVMLKGFDRVRSSIPGHSNEIVVNKPFFLQEINIHDYAKKAEL
jgi:hypothetical protein